MEQNGWFRLDPNYRPNNKRDFFSPEPKIYNDPPRRNNQETEKKTNLPKQRNTPAENSPLSQKNPPAPAKETASNIASQEIPEKPESALPPPETAPPVKQAPPPLSVPAKEMLAAAAANAAAQESTAEAGEAPVPQKAGIHSQTVGPRGPVLIQDAVLHETLDAFVHEKIIERAVHTKGFGAFGHFRCYRSMAEYTKLNFLQGVDQKTPVACRFSLAVSNQGTPDTLRNVRGFSTKFYTEEGNFDLLCNHIPVFLVRDAIRFPEAIQSLLPSPVNNLPDPSRFWEFIARTPEALHFVTWLYSDVGTVKSLRHIQGHGVNTYVWKNARNQRRYVKYHWIPMAGERYISRQEAVKLAGEAPDIAGQDLYDTIAKGESVQYELRIQLMDPEEADSLSFDPLDDTKTWDEKQWPATAVGRLVLDRNPEDYFNQTERIAFSPANLLEGAELSDDKMLQGRSFIYWDAQRRRLGPDFRSLPINKQKGGWSADREITSGAGRRIEGELVREDIPKQEDFTQAGQRWAALSPEQQEHLADNIASELYAVPSAARSAVVGYLTKADPKMGQTVEERMTVYAEQKE